MCDTKFDKYTYNYLVSSDILSPLVADHILEMYKEDKNKFINEWLERKVENNDLENISNSITADLDYFVNKGDIGIPKMFAIRQGTDSKNHQLS